MGAMLEIVEAVQEGWMSPVTAVEVQLEAIEQRNPVLNAMVATNPGKSLGEAQRVARRLSAGETLPLAGVPLAVKDNIFCEGWPITQGSRLFAGHLAPFDAAAVARAREAGAIVIGIAACSEFACKGVTVTPLHGVTRHPMDPALTPGGSSGGSASALAGFMAPAAFGTDAGGSGRRPAAHCGLVGFKPSVGAIPYGPGFPEPFYDLSAVAPMARDVADLAALFEVLAGSSAADPSSHVELERQTAELDDLRIAVSPAFGLDVPVDEDVEKAFSAASEALADAGWPLEWRDPPWPQGIAEDSLMPLQHAGLAALHGAAYKADPAKFDPDIAIQIETGFKLGGADVAASLDASFQVRRALHGFFQEVDLIIGPTTPCVAWPHDRLGPETIGGVAVPSRAHAVFTPLFNHGRGPAISIPCGRGHNRLPVGLQIAGRIGADRLVLKAAAQAERIFRDTGLWTGLEAS